MTTLQPKRRTNGRISTLGLFLSLGLILAAHGAIRIDAAQTKAVEPPVAEACDLSETPEPAGNTLRAQWSVEPPVPFERQDWGGRSL